jgi:hypothetical protein
MYTKFDFGKALLFELDKGYDVVRLSRWAFEVFMNHQGELEKGLKDDIMKIVAMESDIQFELTKSELRIFAIQGTWKVMYTKSDFGKALLLELNKGYDVVRLSNWAFEVFMKHQREFEKGLEDDVMKIVAMEEGPEFELSESELRTLAKTLIASSQEKNDA